MEMRWFTREWVDGDVTDEEQERRISAYEAHVAHVRPSLAHGAEQLLDAVNLHDALLRFWRYEPGVELLLEVVTGDLQVGYEDVQLRYGSAEIDSDTAQVLESLRGRKGVEMLYDEVDVTPDGRYEHRIIAWPTGEAAIRFSDLGVQRRPRDDRWDD